MRAWGRLNGGTGPWAAAETLPNGDNSLVYLTCLIQVLKLARNESPFYANYGIPAEWSILQQLYPDLYVMETQQQFARFFAALAVSRRPGTPPAPPTYAIAVTTLTGYAIPDANDIPS